MTEDDSEICVKNFSPFKDLRLDKLLQNGTDKEQVDSNFELLSKILSVYFNYLKKPQIYIDSIDIDLLEECNVVLDYFFKKL